jgi:hypothetical protein
MGLSREFTKFWVGQSVSMLGNQFTQRRLRQVPALGS